MSACAKREIESGPWNREREREREGRWEGTEAAQAACGRCVVVVPSSQSGRPGPLLATGCWCVHVHGTPASAAPLTVLISAAAGLDAVPLPSLLDASNGRWTNESKS